MIVLQGMTSDEKSRRAERLNSNQWTVGKYRVRDGTEEPNLTYWATLASGEKLRACFEVTRDAWSIRPDYEPHLDFGVFGTRKSLIP